MTHNRLVATVQVTVARALFGALNWVARDIASVDITEPQEDFEIYDCHNIKKNCFFLY